MGSLVNGRNGGRRAAECEEEKLLWKGAVETKGDFSCSALKHDGDLGGQRREDKAMCIINDGVI